MEKKTIQKQVITEVFKNKEFSKAVSEAIGDNLVKAIRNIDDWDLSYQMKTVMSEAIFTDDFKKELSEYARQYIDDNKDDIKILVKDSVSKLLINGIVAFSEKTANLMIQKVTDISKIY